MTIRRKLERVNAVLNDWMELLLPTFIIFATTLVGLLCIFMVAALIWKRF